MNIVLMNKKMIFFFVSFFIFQQASSMMSDLEDACRGTEGAFSEVFLGKLVCLCGDCEVERQTPDRSLLIANLDKLAERIRALESSNQIEYSNMRALIVKLRKKVLSEVDACESEEVVSPLMQGFKRSAGILRRQMQQKNAELLMIINIVVNMMLDIMDQEA